VEGARRATRSSRIEDARQFACPHVLLKSRHNSPGNCFPRDVGVTKPHREATIKRHPMRRPSVHESRPDLINPSLLETKLRGSSSCDVCSGFEYWVDDTRHAGHDALSDLVKASRSVFALGGVRFRQLGMPRRQHGCDTTSLRRASPPSQTFRRIRAARHSNRSPSTGSVIGVRQKFNS